jgi:hypothetical protein
VAPKVMQGGHFQADHHTLMAICALVLGPLAWNFGAIYATHRPIKCNHMMSASAQNLAGGLGALLVALPLGEMHGLGGSICITGSWSCGSSSWVPGWVTRRTCIACCT